MVVGLEKRGLRYSRSPVERQAMDEEGCERSWRAPSGGRDGCGIKSGAAVPLLGGKRSKYEQFHTVKLRMAH